MKKEYKTPCVETVNLDMANDVLLETCSVPKGNNDEKATEDEVLSKDHDMFDWSMDE